MDTLISLEKLHTLSNHVHIDNQTLTESLEDQLTWLYDSTKFKINLDNLEIPLNLVINRLCILYFVLTKKSAQELYQSYFDLDKNETDTIEKLVSLEFLVNSKPLSKLQELRTIAHELCKTYPKLPSHIGLPLPDTLTGRPRINDRLCKFEGCTFNHVSSNINTDTDTSSKKLIKIHNKAQMVDLVDHLKEHKCYIAGMHSAHEIAISKLKLTPSKIIDENITVCPSTICDHPSFKTSTHLILHLTALGIPPFWHSDIGSISTQQYNDYLITSETTSILINIPQKFKCPSCRCTNTNVILAVNYPCFHLNACLKCLKKNRSTFNRCSVCSQNIMQIYPLSFSA
jgi:hypothetical protein